MQWLKQFQLFLFDFDGLLVNTEHLHLQAYINVCAKRGVKLDWSFHKFSVIAHIGRGAFKEALYAEFPDLDPNWEALYADKKREYLDLARTGRVELMPGVKPLLEALQSLGIQRCIVTNSFREQLEVAASFQPVLKTIPHWITRELYSETKPHPECYLKAIALYAKPGDKIIGFEDSIRGIQALVETNATPVLICPPHYPHLNAILDEHARVRHYETLEDIPTQGP